jgi:hypothetical protein
MADHSKPSESLELLVSAAETLRESLEVALLDPNQWSAEWVQYNLSDALLRQSAHLSGKTKVTTLEEALKHANDCLVVCTKDRYEFLIEKAKAIRSAILEALEAARKSK